MGLIDLFSSPAKEKTNVEKLISAVGRDDFEAAHQLLLEAGDACHVREFVKAAQQYPGDGTVGGMLASSGDKETIGVFNRGMQGFHFYGMVAQVELPRCDPAKELEK